MMRVMATASVLMVAAGLAAVPARATTVEEVIAKHVAAHGGKEKLEAIRSMEITGQYKAFSKIAPFTLIRARDNRYFLDRVLDGRAVKIGYNGETLWWDNAWRGGGAEKVGEPDAGVWLREADFLTPFFDYEERGYKVELVGETEYEGIPVIGVKVVREDEGEEIWYLDPESYLAVARVSPGSDFGRPMPQRTFYEDYREVDGVLIPHFTETQWYTRDRVMMIENIKTNVAVDDSIFAMPAPLGMAAFQAMAGSWKVAWSQRRSADADWNESELSSSIELLLGGVMVRESYKSLRGSDIIRTISYDPHREVYRMTQITSDSGYTEIREGTMDEETGRLTVSNADTGTANPNFLARMTLLDITDDQFSVEHEASTDGGENWFLFAKGTYTRDDG